MIIWNEFVWYFPNSILIFWRVKVYLRVRRAYFLYLFTVKCKNLLHWVSIHKCSFQIKTNKRGWWQVHVSIFFFFFESLLFSISYWLQTYVCTWWLNSITSGHRLRSYVRFCVRGSTFILWTVKQKNLLSQWYKCKRQYLIIWLNKTVSLVYCRDP